MLLLEVASFKKVQSDDEIHAVLNKHCKNALSWASKPIVRGDRALSKPFYVLDSEVVGRSSRNTSNFYTRILDNVLPDTFPRRSKSFICGNYANIDFGGLQVQIADLNPFYEFIGIKDSKSIANFDAFVREVHTAMQPANFEKTFKKFFKRDWYLKLGKKMKGMSEAELFDFLAHSYTAPFEATTSKSPIFNDGKRRELWIQGKCVAIEFQHYKKMMNLK